MKLYVILAVLCLAQLIVARSPAKSVDTAAFYASLNDASPDKRFLDPARLVGGALNLAGGLVNAGTDLAGSVLQGGGQLAAGVGQSLEDLI